MLIYDVAGVGVDSPVLESDSDSGQKVPTPATPTPGSTPTPQPWVELTM